MARDSDVAAGVDPEPDVTQATTTTEKGSEIPVTQDIDFVTLGMFIIGMFHSLSSYSCVAICPLLTKMPNQSSCPLRLLYEISDCF